MGVLKKDIDYIEITRLENKLFPELCKILNQHFGTQHKKRYWSIILKPWFKRIVKIILNRVNTLEKCLAENKISGMTVFSSKNYNLAPLDYLSSFVAFENDIWNNILESRILSLLGKDNFPIEYIQINEKLKSFQDNQLKFSFKKKSYNSKIKRLIANFYFKISKKFIKSNDAFIISSYLPLKEEIKLELSLGQFPQIWKYQWDYKLHNYKLTDTPNNFLRKKLTEQIMGKCDNDIEYVLRSLLFELLPIYYLEGFLDLQKITKKINWPKNPKFIFTSSLFYSDELFKLWTANQTELGKKYYIGQHGSMYGTSKYKVNLPEETLSDKFVTWGWTDNLIQHKPAFVLNTAGKNSQKINSRGGLLLIETIVDFRFANWDVHSEYISYLNDQKKFIKNLSESPRKYLTVRLHSGYKFRKMNEDLRWFDFDSKLKLDYGETKIGKLIKNSRLIIYSYDSSGLLETLSQNIPTLAFWQNDLDHLRENAKPYYQLLIDSGIIHLSAESIAHKVNEIWDDIDGWWQQKYVQDARKKFCNRYAKTSQNPISELKQILLS